MNRYVQEAADMDVRHRRRIRAITFICSAVLITVALWAGDVRIGSFDLAQWRQSIRDWWERDAFPEREEKYAIAPQLPASPRSNEVASEPPSILTGTDSSVSSTPLALLLVSTAPGRNAHEGTARLGTHRENPQTYAAGALLANGARLLEIHADHVVLERDDERTKLYVGSAAKANDRLAFVGGESQAPSQPPPPTYTEALTDYLRPSPLYDGTTLRGFQVYAGQRTGVFAQLGLQNGDVILSMNDQPLGDTRQAMESFSQLMLGVAMSATIERNGSRQRISLDGALITRDQEQMKQATSVAEPPTAIPRM